MKLFEKKYYSHGTNSQIDHKKKIHIIRSNSNIKHVDNQNRIVAGIAFS